ncbi:MAG: hypothetical protein L0Y56_00040, partial [Nitrospira sp.]|nr:hypothetical protein [Nitrospira sp.]
MQEITTWYLEIINNTPSTNKTQPNPEAIIRLIIRQIFLRFLKEKGIKPDALWISQAIGSNETNNTNNHSFLIQELNDILEHYQFTIKENSQVEQGVALDPELPGQLFEHLLATDKREVRKRTGSFYTPRHLVNYLVAESLIVYLSEIKGNVTTQGCGRSPDRATAGTVGDRPEQLQGNKDFENRLRHLFASHDEPHQFDEVEVADLIEAITTLKILDPACGSGAFLIGALEKLVYILKKLDPQNEWWKEKQDRMLNSSFIIHPSSFTEWSYFLLENCLYGVDIQPMAVQLTKLRLLLSLLADWKQISEGSPPSEVSWPDVFSLPDLATKIVAANILLRAPASIFGVIEGFDLVIGNPP